MNPTFAPFRARFVATRHLAVAGHYLAAQAAHQILEAGGNAIDAGVAGGISLSVLQSEFVSFGGVAPIMIRLADSGQVVTITGLGHWPKAASLEVFRRDHDGHVPSGILSTVIPAAPDAWITALERFGTMSFADTAQAAIRLARDGFPVTALLSRIVADYAGQYARWPSNTAIYLRDGNPPREGSLFVQEDLGRTIQHMADEEMAAASRGGRLAGLEAARHAFYRGDIAAAMVQHQRENGGWMTAEDLAGFSVEILPPLKTMFGDVELYACGPWCQGPVVPQTLNVLDGFDLAGLGHNSPVYIHHIVEALKLSYADRHRYYGDPNFVHVPMDALLSAPYAESRRKLIDPEKAAPDMPESGLTTEFGEASGGANNPTSQRVMDALDTSYVCVVDKQGNLFSATPSDASASSPVVPGLGFVPSNRGTQSWADPSHAACVAPGKRPRLTPNPAIAIRPGHWSMPFGSPGNDVQVQAMVQVLINIAVFDMTPQDAVEQPRFATMSYPRSSEPHTYNPGLLHVESRINQETLEALSKLGHNVAPWPDWEWRAGAVCAIKADMQTGMMEGAADPRRQSGISGW
jgi:gamma-glutamyltranspeptidase / glutathione hydrolase